MPNAPKLNNAWWRWFGSGPRNPPAIIRLHGSAKVHRLGRIAAHPVAINRSCAGSIILTLGRLRASVLGMAVVLVNSHENWAMGNNSLIGADRQQRRDWLCRQKERGTGQ
jgi:hypothetical protein